MRNKGYSLMELIVVVAIMGVLTVALAPSLIKYVNRSRLSRDLDTGRKLAQAITTVVTDETMYSHAQPQFTPIPVSAMEDTTFKEAVDNIVAVDQVIGTAKRDADGNKIVHQNFYYKLDTERNKVEVFYGGTDDSYMVYPIVGEKLLKN